MGLGGEWGGIFGVVLGVFHRFLIFQLTARVVVFGVNVKPRKRCVVSASRTYRRQIATCRMCDSRVTCCPGVCVCDVTHKKKKKKKKKKIFSRMRSAGAACALPLVPALPAPRARACALPLRSAPAACRATRPRARARRASVASGRRATAKDAKACRSSRPRCPRPARTRERCLRAARLLRAAPRDRARARVARL